MSYFTLIKTGYERFQNYTTAIPCKVLCQLQSRILKIHVCIATDISENQALNLNISYYCYQYK